MPTKSKPHKPLDERSARLGRAGGSEPEVDRKGGRFGAGIIRGVSLACVGEALGHEMWCDDVTIDQVVEYSAAKGDTGLKCRFTHPGMSSDGMGRHLGRLHDVREVGQKAVGDLHFAQSSHDTPDGDLADYVMTLTEEDPAAAGLSIVFHHDLAAEDEFEAANQEDYEYTDHRGRTVKSTRFKSPDPDNEHNYPHVRMNELRASDVVDEPAANPDGMFYSESLPSEVDSLLCFAAGVTDQKPKTSAFGIDGDRAAQFLGRWLESHGLTLSKGPAMSTATPETTTTETEAPSREDFQAELKKFTDAFGAENGTQWFTENKSFEEALGLHAKSLEDQLAKEREAKEQAEARLSSLELGETEELETGTQDGDKPSKTTLGTLMNPKQN